jgi:uncharacterized membrane protein YecN with MAPEG domain
MHITGIYAALGALLLLVLALRISLIRRSARVGIGDGGNHELIKRIRAHANATEYLPIALLLLLLLDLGQTPPLWLHVFGVVLIVGRVLHAIGLSQTSGPSLGRMLGIALTWGVMLVMAGLLLWKAVMY